MFGGASASKVSSKGFLANGARHGQKNAGGTEGIPMKTDESVYIASAKITEKGFPAGKKYGKSQADDMKPYMKYFSKAENNPRDRYLNDPKAKAMLEEELSMMEQRQNEGRFMKGLHDLLKKKGREFGSVMDFIMQENPNEAETLAGNDQQAVANLELPQLAASQQPAEMPAQPDLNQPSPPQNGVPIQRNGGFMPRRNRAYGGGINDRGFPDFKYQDNIVMQLGGNSYQDPSRLSPKDRHTYNVENNIGEDMSPYSRRSYQEGGMMEAEMNPALQEEQAMQLPETTPQDMQEVDSVGNDSMNIGAQVAQQVMEMIPNALKPLSPEQLQGNPTDIFSEGFEKELLQQGISMEEIKNTPLNNLHTGKIGQVLGQLIEQNSDPNQDLGSEPQQGQQQGQPQEQLEAPMDDMSMMSPEDEVAQFMHGGRNDRGFPDFKYQDEIVIQGVNPGQFVKFEKGGRTVQGRVSNYDSMTGDFDLY